MTSIRARNAPRWGDLAVSVALETVPFLVFAPALAIAVVTTVISGANPEPVNVFGFFLAAFAIAGFFASGIGWILAGKVGIGMWLLLGRSAMLFVMFFFLGRSIGDNKRCDGTDDCLFAYDVLVGWLFWGVVLVPIASATVIGIWQLRQITTQPLSGE